MGAYHEVVTASAPTSWYSMDSLTARIGTNMTTSGGTITYAAGPNTLLGNGMVFDGNSWGNIPRIVTDAFSIEFFIKTTQNGSSGASWFNGTGVISCEVPGVTNDLGVLLWGGSIGLGGGSGDTLTLGPTVNDGAWHHIVITRVGSTVEYYKNGVLNNTAGGYPSNTFGASATFAVGALTTGGLNRYVGSLDELAIYTRKITAGEVLNHYNMRALESSFYQVVG